MSSLRRTLQKTGRLLGRDLMRIGERAYAVAPRDSARDAWFSLEAQQRAVLADAGVDLVVDVGANEGQFGRALRRIYAGELLSFEPASAPYAALAATAAADGRWRTERSGLGAETATLELAVSALSVLNSFLPASRYGAECFGDRIRATRTEPVPVHRLDEALPKLVPDWEARRIFLKMDTQGFDLQVFEGAARILGRVVALQSEVSVRPLYDGMPGWIESLSTFEAAGFRVRALVPAALDPRGLPIEYDCLSVRE